MAGHIALDKGYDSMAQMVFVEGDLKDPATQEYLPVGIIAGVGRVTELKLKDCGFSFAYQLIGQFMVNSFDAEATEHWLENEIGVMRPELRHMIIRSMALWCERHL